MMRCAAWIRCSAEFSNILSCLCLSGSLMYLNEATLLNNIRVRYSKDKIYVSTDMRGSGRSVKYCETETVVRSSSSSACCIHSWTQWCVKCTGHTWGSAFRWTCGAENERINTKRSQKQKEKLIKVRGSFPLIVKSQNFTPNQNNSDLGKTTSHVIITRWRKPAAVSAQSVGRDLPAPPVGGPHAQSCFHTPLKQRSTPPSPETKASEKITCVQVTV